MTTLDDRRVKAARKRHQCEVCRKWIDVGEAYWRTTSVQDGAVCSTPLHLRCEAFWRAAWSLCRECFDPDGESFCEMRNLVRDELYATGQWGTFRAEWRKQIAAIKEAE